MSGWKGERKVKKGWFLNESYLPYLNAVGNDPVNREELIL